MQTSGAKPSFSARITQPEPTPEWSLGLAVFFVVALLVLWVAAQALVLTLSGASFEVLTPAALAGGAAVACVVVIAVVVQWARRRFGADWVMDLHLRQPINPPVFVIVLAGLGAAWAIDLLGILLRLKGDQIVPPVLSALEVQFGVQWVIAAVFAVIILPIAEGLVFIGLLYPALTHATRSNWIAVFVTAAVYTVANAAIFNPNGGMWFIIVQPLLMALVMVLVRAYTQSTQSAIVARALFGLFFVLASLISLRF